MGNPNLRDRLSSTGDGRYDFDGIVRKPDLLHWVRTDLFCGNGRCRIDSAPAASRLAETFGGKLGLSDDSRALYAGERVDAHLHSFIAPQRIGARAVDGIAGRRLVLLEIPAKSYGAILAWPMVSAINQESDGKPRVGNSLTSTTQDLIFHT